MTENIVAIDFRSKVLRTEEKYASKVRECLQAFEIAGTYEAALSLCRTACPSCEVGEAQRLPSGIWFIEVRYDHLLHEGEGESAAAALIAALLHISEVTDFEDKSEGRPYHKRQQR